MDRLEVVEQSHYHPSEQGELSACQTDSLQQIHFAFHHQHLQMQVEEDPPLTQP